MFWSTQSRHSGLGSASRQPWMHSEVEQPLVQVAVEDEQPAPA